MYQAKNAIKQIARMIGSRIFPLHFPLLILLFSMAGCGDDLPPGLEPREEMREFVMGISQYARSTRPGFIVIPQNGIELVSTDGEEGGALHTGYLAAIDGHGQEDLFYGYDRDDRATPAEENSYLRAYLDRSLAEVRSFLYLINPDNYPSKDDFTGAVRATNYDLLIMDLCSGTGQPFTRSETALLKEKANGGKRLVIAYMSIGEAEDYRSYWQESWEKDPPAWLDRENPRWEGNYKVRYWEQDWQDIIFGSPGSYLDRILEAGFDGVYLDIIDAFEYYE